MNCKHFWIKVRSEKAGKLMRTLWKCAKCGQHKFTMTDGGQ